ACAERGLLPVEPLRDHAVHARSPSGSRPAPAYSRVNHMARRRRAMKVLVVAVTTLLIMFAVACESDAKTYKRHSKRHTPYAAEYAAHQHRNQDSGGWYEHDANKLPFGSTRWWGQMRREGRLGGGASP